MLFGQNKCPSEEFGIRGEMCRGETKLNSRGESVKKKRLVNIITKNNYVNATVLHFLLQCTPHVLNSDKLILLLYLSSNLPANPSLSLYFKRIS